MRIAYLILHYMAGKDTIECVHSILEATQNSKHETRIIVVDNGSMNDSFMNIQKEFENNENVTLIQSGKNLGFAKGNNLGFRFAKYEWNADFIVQLNNDTILTQTDFNEVLVEKYKEKEYAVLGPDILTADGYHQNPFPEKNWTVNKLRKERIKQRIKYFIIQIGLSSFIKNKVRDCDNKIFISKDKTDCCLHGACLIFSQKFINRFEGLYDGTFLYMEEEILYYELKKYNLLAMYSPSLSIYHKEDCATNAVVSKAKKKQLAKIHFWIDSSICFERLMQNKEKFK